MGTPVCTASMAGPFLKAARRPSLLRVPSGKARTPHFSFRRAARACILSPTAPVLSMGTMPPTRHSSRFSQELWNNSCFAMQHSLLSRSLRKVRVR